MPCQPCGYPVATLVGAAVLCVFQRHVRGAGAEETGTRAGARVKVARPGAKAGGCVALCSCHCL